MFLLNWFITFLCSTYTCDYQNAHPPPGPSVVSNRLLRNTDKDSPRDPIVYTKNGALEGYFMTDKIYAFQGIPYAEEPKMFRASVPKRSWNGVRSAKKPCADCLQQSLPRFLRVIGKMNCLCLNIFTPEIPVQGKEPTRKFPVIIYIHGGCFYSGSGNEYGPTYLLEKKSSVILVTINYRLGVLGFLSTVDEENLGNWGLKDQSLAIKWVYDNIESFSGDKNKITVSGQSAGGISAHLHMLSTTSISRGLFSRAFSMSGSAFHHWGLQSQQFAKNLTNNFAKIVGCPVNKDSKALMDCFRKIEPNFLVAAQSRLFITTIFPLTLFAPVIEPNVTGAFLTDTPENYYKNDLVAKIPYLCTNVANEFQLFFMVTDTFMMTNYYFMHWRVFLPKIYDYDERYLEFPDVANEILASVYFGSENITENGLIMNRKAMIEMGSDRYWNAPNRLALKAHSKVAPTYSYNYHFRSESGMASFLHFNYLNTAEATHCDDLASIFNSSYFFKPLKIGSLHSQVSNTLIDLIINFMDKGEPLHTRDDGSFTRIWDPITNPNDIKFLDISTHGTFTMVPESRDKARKLRVWEWLGIFKSQFEKITN